jgi:uncharacterized membrane protein YedE/YeeE
VNRWLDGLPGWQFVAVLAGFGGLVGALEVVFFLLVAGWHPFVVHLIFSWCVFTLMTCTTGALWKLWRSL